MCSYIYVRNFDTYKERELGVNDNIGKIYKIFPLEKL